jgi:hypothetical protein
MADEKRGARVEGAISPTTIAWFVIGGGFLLLGWKLLNTLSGNSAAAQELTRSMVDEAKTMQLYIAGGNYTDAGLQALKDEFDHKPPALDDLGQNWLTRALAQLSAWLKTFGIYVVWPSVALITSYLIYKLVKNWPKQPPTFRCNTDGLVFPTEEELAQHNATAHQGTSSSTSLHTAQAIFLTQLSYVQDIVAVQSMYPEKVRGDWSWLTPLEVIGLKTAIEVVIGYGIGSGMSSLIPYLVIL